MGRRGNLYLNTQSERFPNTLEVEEMYLDGDKTIHSRQLTLQLVRRIQAAHIHHVASRPPVFIDPVSKPSAGTPLTATSRPTYFNSHPPCTPHEVPQPMVEP